MSPGTRPDMASSRSRASFTMRGWRIGPTTRGAFSWWPSGKARPGRLVGFLVGTVEREIPVFRLQQFGFIHDLWVEPEYRHEGIARQLVMLAVERFGADGRAPGAAGNGGGQRAGAEVI